MAKGALALISQHLRFPCRGRDVERTLRGSVGPQALEWLAREPSIRDLRLVGASFGRGVDLLSADTTHALAAAMGANPRLKALVLCGVGFSGTWLGFLARALNPPSGAAAASIEHVSIEGRYAALHEPRELWDREAAAAALALAPLCGRAPPLRTLCLSMCNLYLEHGSDAIGRALSLEGSTLTDIRLTACTAVHVGSLAAGVASRTRDRLAVKKLSLVKCTDGVSLLGDGFARQLGQVLEGGARLEELTLHATEMSEEGFAALGDACARNPWLRRLNVRGNYGLGDDGAALFAASVAAGLTAGTCGLRELAVTSGSPRFARESPSRWSSALGDRSLELLKSQLPGVRVDASPAHY